MAAARRPRTTSPRCTRSAARLSRPPRSGRTSPARASPTPSATWLRMLILILLLLVLVFITIVTTVTIAIITINTINTNSNQGMCYVRGAGREQAANEADHNLGFHQIWFYKSPTPHPSPTPQIFIQHKTYHTQHLSSA